MFIVATLILILIALQNWLGFTLFYDYGYATLTYKGDGVGHPYPHMGNVAAFLGALAAPYGGERTLLPFYIFVPLMFFYILKIQNMKINSLVLTVVVAFSNYLYIFRGYAKNFSTRNENSIVLKEDSKDIKKGEKINKIVLKKYDTSFSESEPWGLHSFQFLWMRNYYNIPQKVKIIYK
ncbi:hypothetical protein CLAUR_039220 [Clostridium felsineum]|nr:hypothetical protein CLAUR_039220 [Clostridium felsineum]